MGELRLVGARSIDEEALLDGLGLTHARELGQPFARFLVQLDRRRIRAYYVRRGFFGVEVEAEVDRRGARSDVTFTIIEGARARLARVEFEGLPEDPRVTAAALRERIPLDDGAPFEHEPWELSKPELAAAMQGFGYAWALVDGTVIADQERAEAVIRVTVEAGPLAVFGEVEVSGVPAGLEEAVAHRIEVRSGERFAPRALERTRAALYDMGRFSLVRVEPDRTVRGEVVKVAVNVSEAPRHELRLGGGVGADPLSYQVRARAAYGVAAWPTPLSTSRVELRPALAYLRDDGEIAPRLDAIATLDRLDLVQPRYTGSVEASFQYLAVEAYTSFGPKLRLSMRSPTFARAVQASVGWQLGLLDYTDLSDALDDATIERLDIDPDKAPRRLGAYEQSVVVDLRDSRVATKRGAYLEVRTEQGTVAAGGALDYVRLTPEARGYFDIGPIVLAARGRLGALWGEVPATRRFFAGGANSQRGFPERHLAPFATGTVGDEIRDVPIGGAAMLELSGELRFPMPNWCFPLIRCVLGRFAGAAFVDAADVTDTWDALDAGRLHTAAGFGLRLPTPVGAVRFDVGRRLNRIEAGEPRAGERYAFHLSVGEAF